MIVNIAVSVGRGGEGEEEDKHPASPKKHLYQHPQNIQQICINISTVLLFYLWSTSYMQRN